MVAMLSILMVDDDAQIRQLLSDYLSGFGMSVVAVADGKAMVEAMKKSSFDLIILDLMLPGEDGLSLCRSLRAESDIPILMLTARGEAMDRVVGLELGADDYIVKPFEPRELVARIQFAGFERLDDVIVGAQFQSHHPVHRLTTCGEHQDRDVRFGTQTSA